MLEVPITIFVFPSCVVEPDAGTCSKVHNSDDGEFGQQLTFHESDSDSAESLVNVLAVYPFTVDLLLCLVLHAFAKGLNLIVSAVGKSFR